jgi:hypothetical protein
MNDYVPSTPRFALGATALAMTAFTMTALVVLPAKFDIESIDASLVSTARAVTTEVNPVNVFPARRDEPTDDQASIAAICAMPDAPAPRAKPAKTRVPG